MTNLHRSSRRTVVGFLQDCLNRRLTLLDVLFLGRYYKWVFKEKGKTTKLGPMTDLSKNKENFQTEDYSVYPRSVKTKTVKSCASMVQLIPWM